MSTKATQDQRLDYLLEAFKADSAEYKDLQVPEDREGKQRILRSLMNVRLPRRLPDAVLAVQNEYLTGRAKEKGIVRLSDIPAIRDILSIWAASYRCRPALTTASILTQGSSSAKNAVGK